MKYLKNGILLLLLLPTMGIFFHAHCCTIFASYLSIFTLLAFPLAIMNVFFLGLFVYRKLQWKWPYLLATLFSLGMLSSSFGFSLKEASVGSQKMIWLISWNVDNFHLSCDTLNKSAKFIKKYHPDIICLQERPHENLIAWDTIRSVFNYPYSIKNSREDEVLNLAVMSKWPLSNFKECYFPRTYNKFCQVDIQTPHGMLRVFNVHLQTTGPTDSIQGNKLKVFQQNANYRYKQAEQLASAIADSPYPVIVCGDFNDTPLSKTYKIFSSVLQDGFLQVGKGWGGTYQQMGNLFRIDYIFASEQLDFLTYKVLDNVWSDHRIQISELNHRN